MGCCISKCRPEQNKKKNKHYLEEHHESQIKFNQNVEDKLVISQARQPPSTPPIIIPRPHPLKYKSSPSPHSPTASSTSSVSSFTCTTNSSTAISSASSLSTASSKAVDRSFSNEFLWSCYRDNPHITRINSLRDPTPLPSTAKPHNNNLTINPSPTRPGLATILKLHSPLPQMPQKRLRSNSPTNPARHKSFRKELQTSGTRTVGSPSPSGPNGAVWKRTMNYNNSSSSSPKVSATRSRSVSSSMRLANNNSSSGGSLGRRLQSSGGLRRRETRTHRVGPKIDVRDVVAKDDDLMDVDLMEVDIDNPLISLDCFIFL